MDHPLKKVRIGALLAGLLLLLPAGLSAEEKEKRAIPTRKYQSEAWTYTLPLNEETVFSHQGEEPFYADVHAPGGGRLIVRLIPLNADFDLEAWGRDDQKREPYAESQESRLQVEEVILDASKDEWFTIRVTPYAHEGGRFLLTARAVSSESLPGTNELNPIMIAPGEAVHGSCREGGAVYYALPAGNTSLPILVEMTPEAADLNLTVWSSGFTFLRESSQKALSKERIEIPAISNRALIIRISAPGRGSLFTLKVHRP